MRGTRSSDFRQPRQIVDQVAEKLSADDLGRFTTRATRTEAIRVLLVEALRKRGMLK
jgi:hypothetical protein